MSRSEGRNDDFLGVVEKNLLIAKPTYEICKCCAVLPHEPPVAFLCFCRPFPQWKIVKMSFHLPPVRHVLINQGDEHVAVVGHDEMREFVQDHVVQTLDVFFWRVPGLAGWFRAAGCSRPTFVFMR